MRRFLQFCSNLDAKAWRTILVSFVLFGGVGLVFVIGAPLLGLKGTGGVERWMGAGATGPLAPLIAVGGFTLLAFLGAPQFVLIAAAVVAFGPWLGFAYSWLGTLVSSLVGFFLGRRFGARLLSQYGAAGVKQFIDMVGRNGFLASLLVRLVPSAPFIVINMAAGLTPMSVFAFAAGTAIGIIPKIALTCFAGGAVLSAFGGEGHGHWKGLVFAGALWIGAGLLTRHWMKRRSVSGVSDQAGAEPLAPLGSEGLSSVSPSPP